jgi:hypothetical protein
MKRLAAALAIAATTALPAPRLVARSDAQKDRVVAMLDAYGNGRPMPLDIGSMGAFREALERFGLPWADDGPPDDRIRRRRTLAVAALDGAIAASQQAFVISIAELTSLLESGCTILRTNPPSDFERTWMLATIAFAELSRLEGFVTGDSCPEGSVCAHGDHAVARFPDDPRFKAALVFGRREVNVLTKRPLGSAPALLAALRPISASPKRLEDTLWKLRQLRNDPVVGPIARLRLAILHFELRQFDDSRRELGLVLKASTDPSTIYLAHLVAGLGFDSEGKREDARRAFEAAVAADPGILSGALELASHRFALGQHAEGSAVIRHALSAPSREDPWQWSCADCAGWTQRLDQLRAGVVR